MEYKIYVGSVMKINQGLMKGPLKIMYCGMTSENIYTLSPFSGKGYQGFSPNIYYNTESVYIHVFNVEFEVLEVNQEYILLRQ